MIVPGLSGPVKIMRDEKGMAYVYAQGLHDAVMAQGLVTAQDRLFQMQVTRLLAQGRISELVGEREKRPTSGCAPSAYTATRRKHAEMLDERTRTLLPEIRGRSELVAA